MVELTLPVADKLNQLNRKHFQSGFDIKRVKHKAIHQTKMVSIKLVLKIR